MKQPRDPLGRNASPGRPRELKLRRQRRPTTTSVTEQRPPWVGPWLRDSGIVLGSQISTMVVTTALAVVVARELGPSDFGVLAAFQGVALVLTLFVDAGITTHLLRELSAEWAGRRAVARSARADELVSAAFTSMTLAGVVVVACSSIVAVIVLGDSALSLALGALVAYAAFIAAAGSLEAVYRATRRTSLLAVANLVEKAILVGLVAAALAVHAGIPGIAGAYMAAAIVRVVFDALRVRKIGVAIWRQPNRMTVASTFRAAVPFGLSATMPTALVRLDAFLIGLFSTTAAGLYAVGDRIVVALLVIPSTAAATIMPLLAQQEGVRRTMRQAARGMFLCGAVLALIGIAVAPRVVPLVFGPAFKDAVRPVQYMLVAVPPIYASSMMMAGLYTLARERLVLIVMVTCSAVGTSFVLLGQLTVGVNGAAAGYALRYVVFVIALAMAARFARDR